MSRSFSSFLALDDVSLDIPTGGLVALLGPSGCGKTTLLRVLAGLEQPDAGRVFHDGRDVTDVPARSREVGLVFQHYALFRHMNVFENVAFALRVRRRPDAEVRARVDELLSLVQLGGLSRRMPVQLSGGQRQRVALARALAARPKVLLLDEPFGALDARVRQELRAWLRHLHEQVDMTTVLVTHDQEEAFEVADRVVLMNQGRVQQVGSPNEVFDHPANEFVLRFLGQVNVFTGRVEGGRAHVGDLELDAPGHEGAHSGPARVFVRPHDLEIARASGAARGIPADVVRITPLGPSVRIELKAVEDGALIVAALERSQSDALSLRPGERVVLLLRRARVSTEASLARAG
ncbi:MAG: sulfate/molybdate ABC transporter ATP-binding protein [Myxococcaceae bacterium]